MPDDKDPIIFHPDGTLSQNKRGSAITGCDVPLHVQDGTYWTVLARPWDIPPGAKEEGFTIIVCAFTFEAMAAGFVSYIEQLQQAGLMLGMTYWAVPVDTGDLEVFGDASE